MTSPDQLQKVEVSDSAVRLERVRDCPPSLYRFLYTTVGARYHWMDRSAWTDDEIRTHLALPSISVWVLYRGEEIAGYFELKRCDDASVEIAYFGLVNEYVGRGLGKHLLTQAVRQSWALGAARVWLHTCTLDHPAALPNYLKRGFAAYKTETYQVVIP